MIKTIAIMAALAAATAVAAQAAPLPGIWVFGEAAAPNGNVRVFSRCPDTVSKAPKSAGGH